MSADRAQPGRRADPVHGVGIVSARWRSAERRRGRVCVLRETTVVKEWVCSSIESDGSGR